MSRCVERLLCRGDRLALGERWKVVGHRRECVVRERM